MKKIIICFFLFGCATQNNQRQTSSIDFDLSLLRAYSDEYAKEETLVAPYVSTFNTETNVLKFLATDHANKTEHPTFKTVKSIFEKFKPELVILEGFEDGGQLSSPSQIAHADRCNAEGYQSCGEPSYAVYLASRTSIPFVSGDPSEQMILPVLQSKGYSTQDLIGYSLMQLIPQWRRAGELDSETTPARLVKRATWYSEQLNSPETFTFETLKQWYFNQTGEKFDFNKIGTSSVAPTNDGKSTNLNKLSFQVGLIRDSYLVSKIQFGVNKFQRTLVIFGQGHLVKPNLADKPR